MKRTLSILLLAALLLAAAGCGGGGNVPENTVPESDPVKPGGDAPQAVMSVVDRNGKLLGAIDARAGCTAVDGGVFYSIFELAENQFTADAEYRFFRMEDGKDILLGTLADQGYEAIYTRTELGGNVYTLALQGYPFDDKPDKLLLLEFDLSAGTMRQHTVSETGFPYAAMAVCRDKLLIMNHETDDQKTDAVYEFDPAAGTVNKVLALPGTEDSMRGICGVENGVCILRVTLGSSDTRLFIDYYDTRYSKVSERSISELFLKAYSEMPGFEDRQDTLNEFIMNVSCFRILDGRYLFYENFGRMRTAADLKTDEVLFADMDLYAMSVGSGTPVIYHLDYEPDNVPDPEIDVFGGGSLKRYDFKPSGKEKMIRNLSRSASGTWMVLTTDSFRISEGSAALYLWPGN